MGKRVNTAKWMEQQKRWQINVQKDGERRSFYSSTPGRTGQRECNAKADAWLDDNIANENKRIGQLYDSYIEELKLRTSLSNWRNEESRGRIWIKPAIGNLKISKIAEQHLQDIINAAYTAGLARKTIIDIKNSLSSFFKYCRKIKVTAFRPEFIVIPNGAPTKPKQVLQPEHVIILFTTDTTILYGRRVRDDLINAYRLQVLTGLRPGELIGLHWEDVDDHAINIQRSVNIYGETTTGKNKNARRTIILNSIEQEVLDDQRKYSTSGPIFGEITQNKYRKRWEKYCSVNGIPCITPYEIRHTFVSAIQSLPESMVKGIVGHSKSMDTFGVYGHDFGNCKQEASEKVEQIFKSILSRE